MPTTATYRITSISKEVDIIVSQLSENISSDEYVPVQQVSFKEGYWDDIKKELIDQNSSPTKKNTKYPCVILLHPFDSELTPDGYIEAKVDMLIVNSANATHSIYQRRDLNFIPILYPICAELVELLKGEPSMNYLSKESITIRDLHHLTDSSSKQQYILPDHLDAILLPNFQLKFTNKRLCEAGA